MLTIKQDGRTITSWEQVKWADDSFQYGALSGLRRACKITGLPDGEPKPNTLYVVPMDCEVRL